MSRRQSGRAKARRDHAGLAALLRGLLSVPRRSGFGLPIPRRYVPSCLPRSMSAGERGVWVEMIERASLVRAAPASASLVRLVSAGVAEAGCDWWSDDSSSVPFWTAGDGVHVPPDARGARVVNMTALTRDYHLARQAQDERFNTPTRRRLRRHHEAGDG